MARSLFYYDIMFEDGSHKKVVSKTIDDILNGLLDKHYNIDEIQNIIRLDLYDSRYKEYDEEIIECY